MYHLVTDETVILGMLLSHLPDVNESQSDGLTTLFMNTSDEITYHLVICFSPFFDQKKWQGVPHNVSHIDR